MPKNKTEQRIIVAACVGKEGNIVIKLDFVPKMPTFEQYQQLPPEKQGVIAIINKFAALNKEFIAELTSAAYPAAPAPSEPAATEAPKADVA